MGASASKASNDAGSISGQEKMQKLNRTLLNKIENPIEEKRERGSTDPADNKVSLPRQQFIDSSIQGKIREELSKLRKQEADVQHRIEQAIEKESLDRASKGSQTGAKGKSSVLLKQELDDVRSKIERHNQRRQKVDKAPGVKDAREKLVECYKKNPERTLDCWAEVQNFRQSVARAESVSSKSG
jgi:altered-inheritance-of-mitochondria protein 13